MRRKKKLQSDSEEDYVEREGTQSCNKDIAVVVTDQKMTKNP